MNGCRVAIVADDLTGALDAAAPFASRGAMTRVVVTLEHLPMAMKRWGMEPPEVVAVNTESRHLSAQSAIDRVERAVSLLASLSPALWFKKIDSTLRGHAVSESLAASRELARSVLVAPAVPAQGRTTRRGRVLVHGIPLEATDFARDARSRPPLEALDALFAGKGARPRKITPGQPLPSGPVVADVETDADLYRLAQEIWAARECWLAVGAAGLTGALARYLYGEEQFSPPCDGMGIWLVVGSRSLQTQRQVARLRETASDMPVTEVLRDDEVPLATCNRLLVPGPGDGDSADTVANRLGEAFVSGLCTLQNRRHLGFLTGGDIAMAVLRRLDEGVMTVIGEWEPGVVLGHPEGRDEWPLLTKAGGFGDDELLVRLWQIARSHTKVSMS
ncbi:four-carbon acid sugar kinase family protein [Halomonas sp. SL1]|uniref:four-carbon acid sugar kinase family protein n=1 Tax=Halomonas sp. SL1 TaxID=2137478 RepID=UPI000D171381|nr:four-carbon acid sugar kinase family protein [Halomonas sp. SL1]RAH38406.1 four-carbon acid sugar kinase family protein [Halomonas sp. SL1]